MPHGDLLRSSGFRTALLFLAIFLLASALAGSAAYLIIRQDLETRHRNAAKQEFLFFDNLYRSNGEDDLIQALQAHANATRDHENIYLLLGPNHKKLAGNISISGPLPRSGAIDSETFGLQGDYDIFVWQGAVGHLQLLVGNSARDISKIEELFFRGAIWASLVLAAISLSGGFAITARINRRISDIKTSLEQVSDGHFDVRLPKRGNGDDIDRLTTLMDETIQKLGAAVEANRQISADIAHDLKTPMNRLRISIERARDLQERKQPVFEELDEIERESCSILSTFDALLRISQIESGMRKERFALVDVGSVMSDVADFYKAHAEEAGAAIELDVRRHLSVCGDKELLSQLFANLIENALKHGGRDVRVTCKAWREDGCVITSVSDNGPGIPKVEHEKVVRRLYRLEKSRTTPGSGLGLSMVKAIAELHEGHLSFHENNPGLTVKVTFPPTAAV